MLNNKIPRLSVLMTTYNGERFLPQAIDSILAQTYRDFEFIIVDDGSSDSSAQIIREAASRDPRIRGIFLNNNIGIPRAANRGLGEVRAPLVARMDSDDMCHPERFAKQVAYMDEHTDINMLGSFYRDIDEDGNFINARKERKLASNLAIVTGSKRIRRRVYQGHYVLLQPTSFIRTTSLRALGGYREIFSVAEDNDMYLRMLDRFGAVLENHSDCLYYYRRYRTSISDRTSTGEYARLLVMAHYSSDCRLRGRADPLEGAKSLSLDELAIPAEDCSYLESCFVLYAIRGLPQDRRERLILHKRIRLALHSFIYRQSCYSQSCYSQSCYPWLVVAFSSLQYGEFINVFRYFMRALRVDFFGTLRVMFYRVRRYL